MFVFNRIRTFYKVTNCKCKFNYHTLNNPTTSLIKKYPYSMNNFASQRSDSKQCWKCGLERKNTENLFCKECNALQNPVEPNNYFKLFSLEEEFNIDSKQLHNIYRKLQSYLHPDKFSNKSDEEKEISANYSSLINKAYNNLQVPLKRAVHLLQLKGNKLNEDQKIDDPDFLMEMMELNEEFDDTDDVNKLKDLDIKNKNQLENIVKQIDECFKEGNLTQAKFYVIKMKYYASLNNRINARLRELGIVD
ncbi:hypothetical protein ABEB36_002348 [Hypothenemus hampei]|uniref:J domain-containing protein n=1 Tax=Hypothenemus hampei TaxID=57062 RepID=A0ABD1F5F7_HYPHA